LAILAATEKSEGIRSGSLLEIAHARLAFADSPGGEEGQR
jgi:hypothetical protein